MAEITLASSQKSWLALKALHVFWRVISRLPDRQYLRWKYWSMAGRFPHIENPRLFSEKVQVRKLYDRNPLYPVMVDKHAAKALIRDRAGDRYVIATQWIGKDLAQVDWSAIRLPAVVKPTHASGCGEFLRDRQDIDKLVKHNPSGRWMALKHHLVNREWAYGEFEPLIIIEDMLVDRHEVPDDFRFFVFSGKIALVELRLRRDGVGYEAFYTADWQRIDIPKCYYDPFPEAIPRPSHYAEMLDVVQTIAGETDFMRVDLYCVDGRIYVGELTLYPGGGFKGCIPDSLDERLGALWKQDLGKPERTDVS